MRPNSWSLVVQLKTQKNRIKLVSIHPPPPELSFQLYIQLLFQLLIQGVSKKLNKPEIALRLCKAPQCTKFFIEIGCLGTDNAV